jgi:hypothetical protein
MTITDQLLLLSASPDYRDIRAYLILPMKALSIFTKFFGVGLKWLNVSGLDDLDIVPFIRVDKIVELMNKLSGAIDTQLEELSNKVEEAKKCIKDRKTAIEATMMTMALRRSEFQAQFRDSDLSRIEEM